jgi:hypothetical protein
VSPTAKKPEDLTPQEKGAHLMVELAHAEGARAELEMLQGGLNVRLSYLTKQIESLKRRIDKTAGKGPVLIIANDLPSGRSGP